MCRGGWASGVPALAAHAQLAAVREPFRGFDRRGTELDLDRTTVATLMAEFVTLEPVDQREGVQSDMVSWVIRGSA